MKKCYIRPRDAGKAGAPLLATANPMGVNVHTSGTTGLESSALPLFQNQLMSGRGFQVSLGGAYNTLNSSGYPDGSQAVTTCILYSANASAALGRQYWFYDSVTAYRTFKCGFTGSGAEIVTAATGCTVANIVQTGTATTFDLTPNGSNSLFAFQIANMSVALSAAFANLPDYPTAAAGQVLFTNEAVTHLSQFAHLRFMFLMNGWNNNQPNSNALRNTSANTKTRKDWQPGGGAPGFDAYPSAWWFQLCAQCGNNAWVCLPMIDDGTYASAVLTDAAAMLPAGQKLYIEFGNELWNGIGTAGNAGLLQAALAGFVNATFTGTISGTALTVSGVTGTIAIGDNVVGVGVTPQKIDAGSGLSWTLHSSQAAIGPITMYTTNFTLLYEWIAKRCHDVATQARSIFGTTRFNNDVRIVFAVQVDGNGRTFAYNGLNYMVSQGWTPSADIYAISHAPYMQGSKNLYRATFNISGSSGASTFTASSVTGTITPGDLVFDPNIPAGTTILAYGTAGTTGVGGSGTYALSAANTGNLPAGGVFVTHGSNPTVPTIAQLLANLAGTDGLGNVNAANTIQQTATTETLGVLAKYYGLKGGMVSYEGGWPLNTEIWSPNMGAAIMDPGMQTLEESYYAKSWDAGMTAFTRYEGGCQGISTLTGFGPNNALDYNAANLLAGNSPRLKAMQTYFPGTYTPQRNLVNGPGSFFSAANWTDNINGVFPTFATAFKAPPIYGVNGQVSYLVNCSVAGPYVLVVGFVNAGGTGHTNVVLDGVILYSAIAIPAGSNAVTLGTVPLTVGPHSLILGDGLNNQTSITISPLLTWN